MFDDDDRSDRTMDWAGGGGWQDPDPPPDSPPPPKKRPEPPPEPKVAMGPFVAKVKRGLVAGRFLPLHIGHEHLIEVARRCSDDLDVVVFATDGDPIPAATRIRWLRDAFPGVGVYETTPIADFASAIRNATGRTDYNAFYGGEIAQGIAAANALGATFVPVDPARDAFPVSATQIRDDVMKHYNEIASIARPWFVRRVAVLGPESTGKTELCKRLAHIYSTRFVPEPARALAEARGGTIDPAAIHLWVRTQVASEEAVARRANRVLFSDTNATTAAFWSRRLWGDIPPDMPKHTANRDYDLVLVCRDDVPFVGLPERDLPDARRKMFADLRRAWNDAVVIEGSSWEKRVLDARKAVDHLLAARGFLSKRGKLLVDGKLAG